MSYINIKKLAGFFDEDPVTLDDGDAESYTKKDRKTKPKKNDFQKSISKSPKDKEEWELERQIEKYNENVEHAPTDYELEHGHLPNLPDGKTVPIKKKKTKGSYLNPKIAMDATPGTATSTVTMGADDPEKTKALTAVKDVEKYITKKKEEDKTKDTELTKVLDKAVTNMLPTAV